MKALMPQKVRRFTLILDIIGLVIILLGNVVENILVSLIGFVVITSALILYLLLYRCHNCGKFLGRDKAEYCPHCGSEVTD